MATRYTIEEADLLAASAAIQSLWVANLGGHSPDSAAAKLNLGYRDNPAGRGIALLLFSEGSPVAKGVHGLHPRRFHFGARSLNVAGLADYAVDQAHRSLGPALMLMRSGMQLGASRFDLTYGLPNAKAAPVCTRAGLKRLGSMRRYAKPLASREHLSRHLPAWLARTCAPLVDMALSVADRARVWRDEVKLSFTESAWSEPAFDALWEQRQASLLLSQRSGEMLRWRFGHPERGQWHVCVAHDASGLPFGYVIWRVNDGFAEIGDFFSREPQRQTEALMLAFASHARRLGVQTMSVLFFGDSAVAAQLERSGLRLRADEMPVFTSPGLESQLSSPERWYLTAFDNDAD